MPQTLIAVPLSSFPFRSSPVLFTLHHSYLLWSHSICALSIIFTSTIFCLFIFFSFNQHIFICSYECCVLMHSTRVRSPLATGNWRLGLLTKQATENRILKCECFLSGRKGHCFIILWAVPWGWIPCLYWEVNHPLAPALYLIHIKLNYSFYIFFKINSSV